MTTLFLARKLLTMKLIKSEIEKLKSVKVKNQDKKNKVIVALKKILKNQEFNETCRLCLRQGGKKIFGDSMELAQNIKYILGIEVFEGDKKPQHICSECETTLKAAVDLKRLAETTQWRLQQELEMVADSSSTSEAVSKNIHIHGGYFDVQGSAVTKEWSCSKCKQIFHSQEVFNKHIQLPKCSRTRCLVCETCGLKVNNLWNLKTHRLTHTDKLEYACTSCSYRARTIYTLRVHERTHTGARPLPCPHCPSTFSSSSTLASHKRVHMPPRFYCDVCRKGFKFKETLRNHIATQHCTAKPHYCSICGKTFATRKMTQRHERKVHNRPKLRSGIVPTYLKLQQEQLNT